MARIRWSNQALADLELIGDYIACDSPSLAQIQVERIFAAVERLSHYPRSGRIVPEMGRDDLREILFGTYRIVYSIDGDEVQVLTVVHSSRDGTRFSV